MKSGFQNYDISELMKLFLLVIIIVPNGVRLGRSYNTVPVL